LISVPRNASSCYANKSAWIQSLKESGTRQAFPAYAQINDALPLSVVDADEISAIVQELKDLGIEVIERLPRAVASQSLTCSP